MGGGKKGGNKGGGTKKKKTYTKAQQMAKKRISEGKTISSVKASNKQKMTDAAKARHAKFKQTGVQTFGGKKTSFSKAEQQRITDAGYSVAGYSKAKPNVGAGTEGMVAADNAQYGTSFPEGSFAISEEGKAQAEENKAIKAAKESTSLFGDYSAQIGGKLATTFADTFAKPKYMYQGNMAGRLPGLSNYFTPDVGTGMPYMKGGKLRGIPFTGADEAGSLTRFAVPKDAKIGRSVLGVRQYKLNPNQMKNLGMGVTDDVGKFAAKGLGKYGFRAIPFVGAVPSLVDAGVRLKNKDYTGAALSIGSAIPGKIGWASLGGLAAYDASKALTGDTAQVASTADTGGLNIGGVDSGDTEGSNTGRTIVSTDKDKNISYNYGGIAKDAFLGTADALTGNKFDFDNLGRPSDDKTPSEKFETFKKSPLQQAIISKQLGIDANRIINEGGPAADSLMKNYISQIDSSSAKGIRNPIARLFKDTAGENQTDATAMAGRAMSAFSVDDPNFSNDPNALTKALKFANVPQLSEENVQDIRHTFNKTVTEDTGIPGKGLTNIPYSQALGFANRITSGKIKDGVEESMNQLNMKSVPTLDDAVALGSQFATNMKTEGTVTQKRMQELDTLYKKYGPGGGQAPTIPSIIKGIGGPRRTSGSGNNLTISGGNNMTATIPDAITPEILPLPTTVAQGGTNATDLAQIQQQAYNNQLSIYGMNPNYFAQIQQPRFNTRPKRFRQVFNRGYF
tara:strand:+ start:500 stop:2707 length:2208 start_codon:yes stop_codon:yes gene_type:complete